MQPDHTPSVRRGVAACARYERAGSRSVPRTPAPSRNRPPTPRNAPNLNSTLSLLVDHIQHVTDEARANGLHALADQLDTHRDSIAGIALRVWRAEGGGR